MGEAADAAQAAADKGKQAARKVESSRAYQWLVRIGLVSYGVVHLLVAWLAIRLAMGLRGHDEEASNTGALRSLAESQLGAGLLWVVAEVAAGPDIEDVEDAQEELSQGLLALPFGQVLVAVVGLAVLGYGIAQVTKAFRKSFNDDLSTTLTGIPLRLTQAGFVGKGIAIGIVGVLFLWAALDADAQKAGGLDKALQHVLNQPFGTWLLIALAVGIGAYGIYCFFWARHPKHA